MLLDALPGRRISTEKRRFREHREHLMPPYQWTDRNPAARLAVIDVFAKRRGKSAPVAVARGSRLRLRSCLRPASRPAGEMLPESRQLTNSH